MGRIDKIGFLVLDKIFCHYTLYTFKNHHSLTSERIQSKNQIIKMIDSI